MLRIPETPSYLYSSKRWKELHECFDTLAYINQGERLVVKFDKEEQKENKDGKEEISIKNLFCGERSRLINLLLMVFNW